MITKSYLIESKGVIAEFHVVQEMSITASFEFCTVLVLNYSNEAAYLAGSDILYRTAVQVPVTDVQGSLRAHVDTWLITSNESPFKGGAIVPDGSQTLEAAKARAWAAIKVARTAAEEGTFVFDGGVYQADVVRINGAVQLAVLAKARSAPFTEVWTLEDNTTRELDADQVIALGLALGQYVSDVFATGRALRDQINAATTIDEVQAIGWPA